MSELSELKDILSKGSDYFHSQFIASKEYKSIHENKEMVKGILKEYKRFTTNNYGNGKRLCTWDGTNLFANY